jgi:S1-C subfamily serine protease
MSRTKIIGILVILGMAFLFLPLPTDARDFAFADAVTFLGTEGAADQLKKVVFAAQLPGNQSNQARDDDWKVIGSGFFMLGKDGSVLGITCKHVIEAAEKAEKDLFGGVDTEEGYIRLLCEVVYKDPGHDIAIVRFKVNGAKDIKIQNLVFPRSMIDDGSALVEGRGVLMPGYPLALGIEDDRNHPVIRFGMVAQNTGKAAFLVDGFASHGNSGSPVFALKHGDQKLIGMVTSHVSDTINLFNENGQLSARLPYNSGLARVLNAEIIKTALKKVDDKL